jgi:Phospholipid-translocating P-type ATPase C-terminal
MSISPLFLQISEQIFLFQSRWTNYHALAIFFSIISWFATAFFISSFTFLDYNWYNLFHQINTNANFWLTVICLVTLILCKDFYINAWTRAFHPTPLHVVQEVRGGFNCVLFWRIVCGVVWCGVVWCGVLWCAVVCCAVVWCSAL